MALSIVLVEPEYSGNIGFTARAMKNFGLTNLVLVSPKADHLSGEAKARAMHAKDLLKKTRVFDSLEKALSFFDFSVATTSKASSDKKIHRSCLTPREFAEEFSGIKSEVALVFGPEKNGLTNSQLRLCDFLVSIPASKEYRALNLSHSAAILLYEFFQARASKKFPAMNKTLKDQLIKQFNELIHCGKKIKNKADTLASFKALVARSPLSEKEAKAVLAVFSSTLKALKRD